MRDWKLKKSTQSIEIVKIQESPQNKAFSRLAEK
jgi:hypothetical protein